MAVKGSTYVMPSEWKEAIRQSRLGYTPTEATCIRISQALKGHRVTDLTKEHISRASVLHPRECNGRFANKQGEFEE